MTEQEGCNFFYLYAKDSLICGEPTLVLVPFGCKTADVGQNKDACVLSLPSQSPTVTLQSTNTHTQSSSSSSDGGLFRSRPTHSLQPDEDGRVEPYVDFAEFYRLWNMDHGEQGALTVS